MSLTVIIVDQDGDECISPAVAVSVTATTIKVETVDGVLEIPRSTDHRLGRVEVWTATQMIRSWPINGKKIKP